MSTKKDDIPGEQKNTDGETSQKQQVSPTSYTQVNSAELVVSGPNANITVNKSDSRDLLEVYERALQKGQDIAKESVLKGSLKKDRGEEFSNKEERNSSKPLASSERANVFICYSHTDKRYLEELHAHLAYYARNNLIKFWDATMIKPGAKWLDEIQKNLQSAKVAVLLVSAEFLASEFIATKELAPLLAAARDEGVTILSVILSPSAFKYSPFAQFQPVNSPEAPLCDMPRGKRDEVWSRVAECIKDAL